MGRPRGSINSKRKSAAGESKSGKRQRQQGPTSEPSSAVTFSAPEGPSQDAARTLLLAAQLPPEDFAPPRAYPPLPLPHPVIPARLSSSPTFEYESFLGRATPWIPRQPALPVPMSAPSYMEPAIAHCPDYLPGAPHETPSGVADLPETDYLHLPPLSTVGGPLFTLDGVDCMSKLAGTRRFDDLANSIHQGTFGDVVHAIWSYFLPNTAPATPKSPFLQALSTVCCRFPPAKKDYVPFQPLDEWAFFSYSTDPDKQAVELSQRLFGVLQANILEQAPLGGLLGGDDDSPFESRTLAGNPLEDIDAHGQQKAVDAYFQLRPLAPFLSDVRCFQDVQCNTLDSAVASLVVWQALWDGSISQSNLRPPEKAEHPMAVYSSFSQSQTFSQPFARSTDSYSYAALLMHFALHHLNDKKYRKAMALFLICRLSALRFLESRMDLLTSASVTLESVEVEIARALVYQTSYWIGFFSLGLGVHLAALEEISPRLPLAGRGTPKCLQFHADTRPISIHTNLQHGWRRLSFLNRMVSIAEVRVREALALHLPAPPNRLPDSGHLSLLLHFVRADVVHFLCASQREFSKIKPTAVPPKVSLEDPLAIFVFQYAESGASRSQAGASLCRLYLLFDYVASFLHTKGRVDLPLHHQLLLFRLINASLSELRHLLNPHSIPALIHSPEFVQSFISFKALLARSRLSDEHHTDRLSASGFLFQKGLRLLGC